MKTLLSRFRPTPGSLTARAVDALGWNLVNAGARFVLKLGSTLIMTRLLVPEAFAMMAFAMTFIVALEMLTDIGIHQSIVREPSPLSPLFLRVAWTVKIMRSSFISLGVLVLALVFRLIDKSFVAPDSVMAQPVMPYLIAACAVSPVLTGLISTNLDVAVRSLDYRSVAFHEVSSEAIRILCQVGFAMLYPSVWALLVGALVGALSRAALSHLMFAGPRMRRAWDRDISASLWTYGKWIIGSSAAGFVVNNSDKFIFGAAISGTLMGLYSIAFVWIAASRQILNIFTNALGFPVISEVMRDRPEDSRRLIRKYQNLLDLVSVIAFLLLLSLGPLLIRTLYTETYEGAGRIIQMLAPTMLALRFTQLSNIFLSNGQTQHYFIIVFLNALATSAFMLIGLSYAGFDGAITGIMLARFVNVPFLLTKTLPILGPRQTLYDAGFALASVTAILAIAIWV